MANTNAPFGMRPVRYASGAPYNGAVQPYYIPSSYATALYIGDPVIKTGTANTAGVTVPGAGFFDIGTMPEINKATVGTTNKITGAIVGFATLVSDLSKQYNPASTERVAYVADDPDLVFEMQADGAIAAVDIGLNAVLIYTQSGSTITGMSGAELDTGTTTAPATTVGFQLKILRAVNRPDVDTTLTRSKVLVRINNHSESNAVVGF